MALTSAQLTILQRVNEFMRQPADKKLAWALKVVQRRSYRPDQSVPRKMRVKVMYFGKYPRPMFVLQVKRSYVAAYTMENLIKKIVLGGWRPVRTAGGIAKRVLKA